MVESKAGTSKTALTVAAIAIAVIAIAGGLYFFLNWQENRPATPPAEIEVAAHADGADKEDEVSATPFSVCEFGAECPEGDIARVNADGAANIRITVPDEVAQQQWSVLSIYDDPAANSERTFTPGEATEVDIPVTADNDGNDTHLVVMEVSTLLVGADDKGEETPVVTTWAFTTEAK
ncbi:Protein of unknown function [Corynebacterium appendicis CIP 107643]|uniref:DUF2771 domain-containing protein n=1 Tax=Corynebacterium appendicis CIP 107643 TaxID=1161099 RepID=A0A1N7JYQ8_9CORY|nr:DUF2771 domain-containing protein [Corynebacterium appendicis]WJY60555.1 hypothetical protein CAPP_03110 [Corynebacterium appendicis CIP 107643]SIS54458.1 Protein of unknown function [Corynebacterium appendicis CIP 107643]